MKEMAMEAPLERHFTLEYWKDEEWYVGRIREIPGVFSQGETLKELEENIRDAYGLMIAEEAPLPTTNFKTKDLAVQV